MSLPNPYLPFHAWGLRGNPFHALMPNELAEVAVLPEALHQALERGSVHLQIRGKKGRGKSTILLGLQAIWQEQGLCTAYERIPEGHSRFYTDPRRLDVFLLDEAQRLSRPERRRLLRLARAHPIRLALGNHADFGPLFARSGLPLTTIRLEDSCSAAHIQAVIERRLAAFSLPGKAAVTLAPDVGRALYAAYGSDLRTIEDVLYVLFQYLARRVEGPLHITPADLLTVPAEET